MNPTTRPTDPTVGHPTIAAGWIYLHHTADDPHKYVGQTIRPPYKRINEERRTFPWGPDLLPGRQGYTIVARVPDSGDPIINGILLDLAEAVAIRRYNPTENINRPDPTVFRQRLALARAGQYRPAAQPRGAAPRGRAWPPPIPGGRTPRKARQVRPIAWGRVVGSILWGVFALWLCIRGGAAGASWEVVPIAALLGPWATARMFRKPSRRRRTSRSRRRRR